MGESVRKKDVNIFYIQHFFSIKTREMYRRSPHLQVLLISVNVGEQVVDIVQIMQIMEQQEHMYQEILF